MLRIDARENKFTSNNLEPATYFSNTALVLRRIKKKLLRGAPLTSEMHISPIAFMSP